MYVAPAISELQLPIPLSHSYMYLYFNYISTEYVKYIHVHVHTDSNKEELQKKSNSAKGTNLRHLNREREEGGGGFQEVAGSKVQQALVLHARYDSQSVSQGSSQKKIKAGGVLRSKHICGF